MLMDDAENCRRKMTNSSALIQGLSGERVRWTEASKGFAAQIHKLVGDVLLATGFLSYSGPFNQEFRNLMLKSWKREMVANKIPFSEVYFFFFYFFFFFCDIIYLFIYYYYLEVKPAGPQPIGAVARVTDAGNEQR